MAKKENTELALAETDQSQFAIMTMEQNEMKELLAENLGNDTLSVSDFDRVTVPPGGGLVWTIPSIDGEKHTDEIVGIIIHTQIVRAYWESEFTGGGAPPDCRSEDGLIGVGNPGGQCLGCPYNSFEENGGAKACSESRLIFMLLKDETLPIVIKAPVMSLKNARQYLRGLTSKRRLVHSVYTSLKLEKDKNKQGIAYSKIVFSKVGDVEKPDITKAYAQAIKPFITKTASELAGMK